jgi:MFS family permease
MVNKGDEERKAAFHFIILLGIVSLFGDITYEGARAATGPYLGLLGASAGIVGVIAGLGEFIGYALRLFSGYFADKTKAYWAFTIAGYGLILAIPLLGLAGTWQVAAIFIITERIGKALRTPARDTILSYATSKVGRGWGFGIHEALDQIGAIIGPLLFSFVFMINQDYRDGFSVLCIPAILTFVAVIIARKRFPHPVKLEDNSKSSIHNNSEGKKFSRAFWFYGLFTFVSVTGFANFQLISYHLVNKSVVPAAHIPIFYAIAMGVDALVALAIGRLYDKVGFKALLAIPLFTLPLPFLGFSSNYYTALIGAIIWGTVMGIHETIMRAAIADITPLSRKGTGYGIFNTLYGLAWLVGGGLMGLFYEISLFYLILFSVAMEIISLVIFISSKKIWPGYDER